MDYFFVYISAFAYCCFNKKKCWKQNTIESFEKYCHHYHPPYNFTLQACCFKMDKKEIVEAEGQILCT